jgi:hypothetical protein
MIKIIQENLQWNIYDNFHVKVLIKHHLDVQIIFLMKINNKKILQILIEMI